MSSNQNGCRSDLRLVGDPVDVITGEMTDLHPDFRKQSPIPFDWLRYYSSARSNICGTVGRGFTHSFEHRLIKDLDGLRYEAPDGSVVGLQDIAVEESDEAAGATLVRIAPNNYSLTLFGTIELDFSFTLDKNKARLVSARDDEAELEFKYDDEGKLVRISDLGKRQFQVHWNDEGLISYIEMLGQNPNSNRTLVSYEYDRFGCLLRAKDLYDGVQSFTYDKLNRLTRRTDRRGYSFLFAYDELGRCVRSRGEDGQLEVFLDYKPESRSTIVRHGNGGQWIYFYDENGNITQITDPFGFATKYVVDELGRTVEEIDPNGNVTQFHYNAFGEHDYRIDPNGYRLPTLEEDPDPPDPLSYELPELVLEWEQGNTLNTYEMFPPSSDDPILVQFPAAVVNRFCGIFKPEEELHEVTVSDKPELDKAQGPPPMDDELIPFAHRSEFDPNGNLVRYFDRDGKSYRFTYASWNLPFQEIDPLGNTDTFFYGVHQELSSAKDAGGTEHKFAYDVKYRLTKVHYGGKLLETFIYDAADNLIEKRNGKGKTLVTWEIGPGNLDKSRRLANGELHVFEYDERGRVILASTPKCTVACEYDIDGVLIKDLRDDLGVGHDFQFGQIVSTAYFKKFLVLYDQNENGDWIITDPSGASHITTISPNGLIMRRLANGSREIIQYDSEGRCQNKAVQSSNQDVWLHGYQYSPEGDLRFVFDSKSGPTTYEYDEAHRLTQKVDPQGSHRYEYNRAGNLLKQPGLANVGIGSGNRLESANGDSFAYDDRDNLVARRGVCGTIQYGYDFLDQLVSCNINGKIWTAQYDALGRRTSKTWNDETTEFYWDDFRLAAERCHDGSLRLYIYADSKALVPFMLTEYDSEDDEPEDGNRYYIFANQLGAPIRLDNESGKTVWQAGLDPYGTATVIGDSDFSMPIRFPGHYHDVETGLHYNRFRYYSPEHGRYIQPDPLGIAGGINLFAYVDNPLIQVDIDGLKKSCNSDGSSNKNKAGQKAKTPKPPTPKRGIPWSPRKKNIGVPHPNRKSAKDAAAHGHGGKPRPTPPKSADKKKKDAHKDQEKYKNPESHTNSKHPKPHYHEPDKEKKKEKKQPNIHHEFPG